jgi:MFS transporter, PPP family, 3-phenylpropionic acid transporter
MTQQNSHWFLVRGWPLALFWFFYFAGQGIFFPYYALYLRENARLTGTQVGAVLAALPLMGIFAQPFWGQLADRTGARTHVLAVVTAIAGLGYSALAAAQGFVQLLVLTAILALFANAVIPIGVSVCFAALGRRGTERFGLVRVWGTVGFLLLVVGFPQALRFLQGLLGLARVTGGPSEPGLAAMFPISAGLTMIAAVIAWRMPRDRGSSVRAAADDWRVLLHHAPVVRLLLFTLGAYLCLQGPIALFPVYVRSLGGDMDTIGRMWIMMLLLEIPLVAYSGPSLVRVGARGLLAIGTAAGGLRWAVCGLSDHLPTIYIAQLLHGVVVAGLMVGGPLYLEAVVPQRLRSTGQTLLSTVGMSLASILSNIISGGLMENVGVRAPYLIGGIGAFALGCLVPWLLPVPVRVAETPRTGREDGAQG